MNKRGISRLLLIAIIVAVLVVLLFVVYQKLSGKKVLPSPAVIDLDVTYIERTPRYERYNVQYISPAEGISLPNGTSNPGKKAPDNSETVTFIAHIKNKGIADSGSFNYQWKINDQIVNTGVISSLSPGQEATVTYQWSWETDNNDYIEFIADYDNTIAEDFEQNNALKDKISAPYLRMHVEQSTYNLFNEKTNLKGTKSFEDWIQSQISEMNQLFSEAGTSERVRIDQIIVQADGSLPPGGTHAPDNWEWDGSWGFTYASDSWDEDEIDVWVDEIQYSLLHELGHQIGLIDNYNLNYDWNNLDENDIIPDCNTCNPLLPYCGNPDRYRNCTYYNPHMLDLMNFVASNISEFTSNALENNIGKRRGYFGDYLFDIPDSNYLRFTKNEIPISNINVEVYQVGIRGGKKGIKPEDKIFSNVTNSEGKILLPNRNVTNILTTETGYQLKLNPFGDIDIVGRNGIFLIKISNRSSAEYKYLDISEFNVQYWRGNTDEAIYNIEANLTGILECNDGLDNDADTLIDWPADLECINSTDNSEAFNANECYNASDIDNDGLIDYNITTCPSGRDFCPGTNSTYFSEHPEQLPLYFPDVSSSYLNLSNVTLDNMAQYTDFVILEKTNLTKIKFKEQVRLARINETGCFAKTNFSLDSFIKVEDKKVFINSSYSREFNKSAEITFYNVSFKQPAILKDGNNCSNLCNITFYNSTLKTLTIEVPGFSVYDIVEGRDISPPDIDLDTPDDDITTSTNITFRFMVSDSSSIANCSLIINNAVSSTIHNATRDTLISISKTLGIGNYTWRVNCTDSFNNKGSSSTRNFVIESSDGGDDGNGDNDGGNGNGDSDTTPPVVTLISPESDYSTNSTGITFSFRVSDSSNIESCSLILNDATFETKSSITKNITQQFSETLTIGSYTWKISCVDSSTNEGFSSERNFIIGSNTGACPSGKTRCSDGICKTNCTNISGNDGDGDDESNAFWIAVLIILSVLIAGVVVLLVILIIRHKKESQKIFANQ